MPKKHSPRFLCAAASLAAFSFASPSYAASHGHPVTAPVPRSIGELVPAAIIHLGKTADWVAITTDAVWVASTGPFAVHRIDPATNQLLATVSLPGEPCSGLAVGFGSLWVPLCTAKPSLAKVDLTSNQVTAIFPVGPAGTEGGVTTSAGSVWLIVDKSGSLARVDPATGAIRQTVKVPPGSYNPFFSDGVIWVTRAEGSKLTGVDPVTGRIMFSVRTGPNPRFLTAAAAAIWTLNQGDGTLTQVDAQTGRVTAAIALGTPGHGGDIGSGAGMVWTTMPKMPLSATDARTHTLKCRWAGPGGDSLGIGHGAIWLTDYHGGTVSRIPLKDALAHCNPLP